MSRVIPLSELPQIKHSKLHMSATTPPMYISIERHRFDWTFNATVYEIEVGVRSGDTIRVHKLITRFSMLDQLDQQLRKISADGVVLRDFPPKKFWGKNDPAFLEQREKDLQAYLDCLTRIPRLLEMEEATKFFGIVSE